MLKGNSSSETNSSCFCLQVNCTVKGQKIRMHCLRELQYEIRYICRVTENLFLLPEILKNGKSLLVFFFFLTSETSHLFFLLFFFFAFFFKASL